MNTLIYILGWVFVAFAGLIVLTEIIARLLPKKIDYDCRKADGYVAENALWSDDYFREWRKVQLQFKWEPFSYWRSEPHSGQYINVGADGVRQTWNPPLEPATPCFEIFLLGGSTMWGAGVRDNGTIASLLSRMLASESIPARVTNFAQIGYVSTQEVITLIRLLQAGATPDLVVFYDGYNDVLSALVNRAAGLSYREDHRAQEFLILKRPAALAFNALRSLAVKRLFTEKDDSQRKPLDFESALQMAGRISSIEIANILTAKSLGREFGFDVQFFWQPNIFQKNFLSEYERSQRDAIEFSRDVFFETTRLLAKEKHRIGAHSLTILDDVFEAVREPCFIDWAHLTEGANEIIARRLLAAISPTLMKRKPVAVATASAEPQT